MKLKSHRLEGTRAWWHPALDCYVLRLSYSYEYRQLVIETPRQNVTDMSGAVRLARHVDRAAAEILVWDEGADRPHTRYTRTREGWISDSTQYWAQEARYGTQRPPRVPRKAT